MVTFLVVLFFSFGCTPRKDISIEPSHYFLVTATDVVGNKYRLISKEIILDDNLFQSELWEKFDPLDTNHWYSPVLGSEFQTNGPMMFNCLSR